MAKFHKSGSKEPFLWNCAATAARRNRKAVYSVDIILMGEQYYGNWESNSSLENTEKRDRGERSRFFTSRNSP